MAGPLQWFLDASAFKNTKITERVVFRLNVDFFNVLNNPNNPAGLSSANERDTEYPQFRQRGTVDAIRGSAYLVSVSLDQKCGSVCNTPATGPCQCAGRLPIRRVKPLRVLVNLPIHTLGGPVVDQTGTDRSYDYLVDWLDEQLRLKPDANTDLVEEKARKPDRRNL